MGSGGGGSSGKVDYPTYLKKIHCKWLVDDYDLEDTTNYVEIESSMTAVINAALGASPYTGLTAYDPTNVLDSMDTQITALLAVDPSDKISDYLNNIMVVSESGFAPGSDFESYLDSAKSKIDTKLYSESEVDDDIEAFGTLLTDQLDSVTLPRFRRGMQDINAVQTSAFVLGAALIEDSRVKELVKYGTALRLQNYQDRNKQVVQSALAMLQLKLQAITSDRDYAYRVALSDMEFQRGISSTFLEATKMKLIANKEETDVNREIDVLDAKWDMEAFQIGSNMLAAVAGGAPSLVPKQNTAMSVLGGVLSGLGAGASTGNPLLAIGGGLLGGIGGFLGS